VNPTTGKDVGCLPPGVPRIYIQPFALEMIQSPGRVLEYFEFDHHIRQIFTDGRQHPKDPELTWMGDSIGWYEGDTLVIDTVGLNEKTWIDRGGLPHSSQLHVTERIRRPNHDALEIAITIDDPKAYTTSWSPLGTSRNSFARTMATTTRISSRTAGPIVRQARQNKKRNQRTPNNRPTDRLESNFPSLFRFAEAYAKLSWQ
jgi:hypothetical protein